MSNNYDYSFSQYREKSIILSSGVTDRLHIFVIWYFNLLKNSLLWRRWQYTQ